MTYQQYPIQSGCLTQPEQTNATSKRDEKRHIFRKNLQGST
mgnify:CR=1 FL=1